MKVLIRALPESGGGEGVYPCPNFLVLFFHQVIVPKKVIFYPKLTIFVGFSVIFVIIIIKITKILIKIIMATIIIIISIFFHHTRKTSFLSAGKKGPRCSNWGVGLANSGNARIKTFIYYCNFSLTDLKPTKFCKTQPFLESLHCLFWATLPHLGHSGPFGPFWAFWATLDHFGPFAPL